jgi:hypothetical protein
MTVLAAIAEWSVLAFGLLLLGIQVLVQEIGFWFGRRHSARAVRVGAPHPRVPLMRVPTTWMAGPRSAMTAGSISAPALISAPVA